MNIQSYIDITHNGDPTWFVEETKQVHHSKRITDILSKKEYLSGLHKILYRPSESYNGKTYEPRKIVLQYCKTILGFQTSYLLQNPVTLTGSNEVVTAFQRIYKKGKYNKIDFDILDNVVKYGNAYEYIYFDRGVVKSKLIAPEDSYPVYNHEGELIAFIECYTSGYSDYYNVYYPDRVDKWSNAGTGDLSLIGSFASPSGLPVCYKNKNELDQNFGRSELDDFIGLLDNMEDILSKFTDSFYKHHNPIPVVVGQQLKGDGINQHIVGR